MTRQFNVNLGQKLPKIRTSVPGPESQKLSMLSMMYEPQSITRISANRYRVFWGRAAGANVVDVDNNIYIDCTSAFGVAAIGHTSPFVVGAITKQSKHLLHSMGHLFSTSPRVALSKRLVEVVGRNKDSQVLFATSGSECVEIAIKAALLFTRKPGIIAFSGSFHGQSFGALNVTGHQDIRDPFGEYLSKHIRFMPFPYPYREGDDDVHFPSLEVCLERIESDIQKSMTSSSEIGAVIFEPIQGINGYIVPPDSFIKDLYNICKKYGVLMIADEVFTGFGRTGKWLALDHLEISADIVCVGKILGGGMPISACISYKEIFQALQSPSFLPLQWSTFAGDPLACTCALEVIHQIESQGLLESSLKKGQMLLDGLMMLKEKYQIIGDVRGRGLLVAIEVVEDRGTKAPAPGKTFSIVNEALRKGVIVLVTRIPVGNVIGLAPPLTITDGQIDYIVKTLDECIYNVLRGKREEA